MGGYGCFVTCVSMVSDILPSEALNRLSFDGAMLVWESIKNIGLEPIYKGDWDNAKALEYVAANGQCIARVDFDGSDRTDDTHFVVLIGNKRLYDPWTGTERPTSAYSKYTGIRACRKVNNMAGLPSNYGDIIHNSTQWEDVCKTLELGEAKSTQASTVVNTIGGYKSRITVLEGEAGKNQAEIQNRIEQVSRVSNEVIRAQEQAELASRQLKLVQVELIDMAKAKGQVAIDLEQANKTIETLKSQAIQGGATFSIREFFSMLLNGKITLGGK